MGSTGTGNVALTQYGRNTESYKSLFPMPANVDEANEIARFNFRIGQYENIGKTSAGDLQEKTVNLNQLSNSQLDVNKAKVDSLMQLGIKGIQDIQSRGTTSDIPYVIKYGNTYMIQDGHHRLTAMKALGAKTAKVKVLDLEKYMKGR